MSSHHPYRQGTGTLLPALPHEIKELSYHFIFAVGTVDPVRYDLKSSPLILSPYRFPLGFLILSWSVEVLFILEEHKTDQFSCRNHLS